MKTLIYLISRIRFLILAVKDQNHRLIKHRYVFLRSAVTGRLYKHHSKHTSNSGFDRSFMPCSGYILFAAEQRVGYQISWVDLQREVNCP